MPQYGWSSLFETLSYLVADSLGWEVQWEGTPDQSSCLLLHNLFNNLVMVYH